VKVAYEAVLIDGYARQLADRRPFWLMKFKAEIGVELAQTVSLSGTIDPGVPSPN